jgi:Ca2+-binding EF-hand superfamily protein
VRVTFERAAVDEGCAEQGSEFDEFKQHERTPGGGDILALTLLSDADIEAIFAQFDSDEEGEMNVFQLGGALAATLGRPVTTREIWAMLSNGELEGESSVNVEQFVTLLRAFDWLDPSQRDELPDNVFEHIFRDEKLGFGFQVDDESGFVKVSKVVNANLSGIIELDDKIVAINGAPLGVDEDPQVRILRRYDFSHSHVLTPCVRRARVPVCQDLVQRLRPLSRPLRITFERTLDEDYDSVGFSGGGGGGSGGGYPAGQHEAVYLSGLSDGRVGQVFSEFDRDGSGDLDTFELADALGAILGRPATTREVWGVISHGELEGDAALSLEQFDAVLRSFDWADPALAEPLPDAVFECTFADEKLGLAVVVDEGGAVLVSRLGSSGQLSGVVEVDDQVIAVNGAPIGFMENAKVIVGGLCAMCRTAVEIGIFIPW